MEDKELQQLTEEISLSLFHKPFRHAAVFNNRLRTVGGRYMLRSHNIEVNRRYYEKFGLDELIGIIKHELCHYHLHIEGKGYKHRDADFRNLMKEVGAPRFCSTLNEPEKKKAGKVYVFQCTQCSLEYIRKRNMNLAKYVCGKCRGRLVRK